MKNIVIIGGGTGTYTLLAGLRQFPTNNAVIVSTADDGGSTGILRRELGILPPGDLRQCLVGLSYTEKTIQDLFSYRFVRGSLAGHNVGNIILAALQKITADPERTIAAAAKLLNVRGEVVPVTLYPTFLSARLANGKIIKGEHNIDEPGSVRPPIKDIMLVPKKSGNPRALKLIQNADAIVFGPGDLYTSIIPNLLVKGVKEAIKKSKAKKIYISNIMTKLGQTDGFSAADSVKALGKYVGAKIDAVVVNTGKLDKKSKAAYRKERSAMMPADLPALKKLVSKVVAENLISKTVVQKSPGDRLKRSKVRHDSEKLARIIYNLVSHGN